MTTKIPVELSSTPSIVDNGDATAITIDSSERVGLNGLTPSDYYNTADDLVLGGSSGHGITIVSGTSENGAIFFADGTSGNAEYEGYLIYEHGTNVMRFATSATERMRIDSSGNVGIGTTPATGVRLDIRNDSTTNIADLRNANSSGYGLYVAGGSSSSQYALRAADKDNNALFSVMSDGNVGIGTTSPTATYKLSIASAANHGAFIYDVGNGYAAIVTKPDSSNNIFPMYMLNNAGSAVGYILSSSSGTTFSQSGSDVSFKENIKDWNENVLDSFKNIKPSTFTYKSDEDKKEIKGYIAQNEFDKFPEAYPINPKDGKHWFNPSGMTVYLMKAIQEQQTIIEDLQTQINEVKNGN